jgi:hypothetical protein
MGRRFSETLAGILGAGRAGLAMVLNLRLDSLCGILHCVFVVAMG